MVIRTMSFPAFSSPAISTPAQWCRIFQSRIFRHSILVLHCPILHFPPLRFPVPHFPVSHFQRPLLHQLLSPIFWHYFPTLCTCLMMTMRIYTCSADYLIANVALQLRIYVNLLRSLNLYFLRFLYSSYFLVFVIFCCIFLLQR